jgi:hypothetical protein
VGRVAWEMIFVPGRSEQREGAITGRLRDIAIIAADL